jgi:hypothetical protein
LAPRQPRVRLAALFSGEHKIKHRQELEHLAEVPPSRHLEVCLVANRRRRSSRNNSNSRNRRLQADYLEERKAACLVASSSKRSNPNNLSNPHSARLLWRHHNLNSNNLLSHQVFGLLVAR